LHDENKKNEMDGAHKAHMGHTRGANSIWWKTLRDRDHWENLGPYGRIILKWIFWHIHIIHMTPGQLNGKN
jgi:hypothetical protein